MKRSTLLAEVSRLLILVAIGTTVGALAQAPAWGFGLTLLILTFWHVLQGWRVLTWWRDDRPLPHSLLTPLWQDWVTELTRTRQHEKKEKSHRQRLQRSFDALSMALPDAAVVVDSNLHIEWYNKAAETLFGLQENDRGRVLTHVVRHPDLTQYLQSGDFALPLELETFADTQHPLGIQVTVLDQHTRMITFVDLTHGLRLDRLRQEFVANVSHEIKSPLTVVTGYLETLNEHPDEVPDPSILHKMSRQCLRMRRLVDDLLELSRLEASELRESEMENVDLPTLAREVQQDAQTLTSETLHEIRLDGEDDVSVLGRQKELYSALFNLVSNALRYSPEGSKIIIKWRRKQNNTRLSIIDHGIGIPKEHISRITERFYRVDKARSRDTGGTGLGLAIVKHILQRHGARLQIDSEEGSGTTFTCVFPNPQADRFRSGKEN